jgi:hypothetical protein
MIDWIVSCFWLFPEETAKSQSASAEKNTELWQILAVP